MGKVEGIVAVISVIGAVLTLWLTWWMPISTRIRERLAKAKPLLDFSAGPYGGPGGWGVGVNLQNKGSGKANNIVLEIPGTDSIPQKISELEPGPPLYVQIPFPMNSPARKQPMNGLQLRIVYRDRFGREFVSSVDLEPQKRADGDYNLVQRPNQQPQIVHPSSDFFERWRLRNEL